MHCSIPGLYPLNASSTPHLKLQQSKMSLDIAKCPGVRVGMGGIASG